MGISFSSTEETLTRVFSNYGRVLGVDVMMDKVRCRPKGFAYVTFSSKEEADKALLELNGQLVDGRVVVLEATKAVKQEDKPDSKPKHAGGDIFCHLRARKEFSAAKKRLFQKVRQGGLQHFIVLRRRKKKRKPVTFRVFARVQVSPGPG
ncbi:unnamed protein product [Eruca vesicaria subsp. sativa]|uniref:RRM domain-containing protein n=1 Tax=Eruca vesicaria subsp. sativa TaxID=29727 RepID=A0ABC8IV85_ERUVS|nr:unnamed protein product [Eruca vesicaria subsp. sativa]